MLSDGQRLATGRIESQRDGGGLTVIVYDLIANEPLSQFHHPCRTNDSERVTFMAASADNRFVIAAFQRSLDCLAAFIAFDLTSTSGNSTKPIFLDASAEVSIDDTLLCVWMNVFRTVVK
jgi:hypothetical protein